MPLLVHGISTSDDLERLPPPIADDVALVSEGAVVAAVRWVAAPEVLPSRANLLAHTTTLEALMTEGPILPMRFGMVADDEDALVDGYLAPQHDELLHALEQVRDKVELRLHGRYVEAAVLRDIVSTDPEAARLKGQPGMDARMRLGERIVECLESRRAEDLERATQTLQGHVAGLVVNPVSEPLDVLSLSLLVPQDGRSDFDRAVDELGVAFAPFLSLELIGPVPAFSFAVPEGAVA
jgi:hypothetical protein